MRIIGGTAAGTILSVPKGFEVRPTPDLVRQAIFNSLGPRVIGADVLELFAGTGALALECLSRGAQSAQCVEKSNRHAEFIRRNLAAARLEPSLLQIRVQDAFIAVAQMAAAERRFGLVIADPPYGEKNVGRRSESFAQRLLDDTNLPGVAARGGLFILGHTKRDTLTVPPPWVEERMLKHGDSVVRFFRYEPSRPA